MVTQQIDDKRIKLLNETDPRSGKYTLYWMQQSQRTELNHALEFAVQRANANHDRLLVVFALTDDYPEANLRHYCFMLEGLQQVSAALDRRNIKFVLRTGSPPDVVNQLAKNASEVICDRGYLRHQVAWREEVAKSASTRVWQVESDVVVPVETASDKREYAARTIRSQLNKAADNFLEDLDTTAIEKHSTNLSMNGEDLSDVAALLDKLSVDRSVEPVPEFVGGTSRAKAHLRQFIENRLAAYGNRKDLINERVSYLSPYLHFGQISPVEVALQIKDLRRDSEQTESFLDELIVRRELAINFVHYEKEYDSTKCLPDWARETLERHEDDEREYQYTSSELEAAETHDPAWNAAMTEMKHRGYLHNHLRMYWGKKIIEWTNTTNHAYRTTLELNNKYFLDGRDANSYANVLWLFGLHDRAHGEREVFGKVRYMSYDGLRRKCDLEEYIQKVSESYGVTITGHHDDDR